jgi:hypothetical protein
VRQYAKKIDTLQTEVVSALRKIGASVTILSAVGKGVPDLLVGFRGVNFLIEVKSHSKAKLTPDQVVFFGTWCGQVSVVYSVEEAISLVTSGKKDML